MLVLMYGELLLLLVIRWPDVERQQLYRMLLLLHMQSWLLSEVLASRYSDVFFLFTELTWQREAVLDLEKKLLLGL